MAEERHTAEYWKKKLGSDGQEYSKDQYEKMRKQQQTVKNLLTTGRNLLQGIENKVAGQAARKRRMHA